MDVNGAWMRGDQKLICELTVREGKVVYDLNGITREDWDKLGPHYTAQGDPRWDATIGHTVRSRRWRPGRAPQQPANDLVGVKRNWFPAIHPIEVPHPYPSHRTPID